MTDFFSQPKVGRCRSNNGGCNRSYNVELFRYQAKFRTCGRVVKICVSENLNYTVNGYYLSMDGEVHVVSYSYKARTARPISIYIRCLRGNHNRL